MLIERCITTQTMDPKWTQNGLKMDSKWTQNGPKMDPKWTQNGPKMDPKWTQNGPKMDPKWTQNGPKVDTELDTHINAFGAWHTYKRGSPFLCVLCVFFFFCFLCEFSCVFCECVFFNVFLSSRVTSCLIEVGGFMRLPAFCRTKSSRYCCLDEVQNLRFEPVVNWSEKIQSWSGRLLAWTGPFLVDNLVLSSRSFALAMTNLVNSEMRNKKSLSCASQPWSSCPKTMFLGFVFERAARVERVFFTTQRYLFQRIQEWIDCNITTVVMHYMNAKNRSVLILRMLHSWLVDFMTPNASIESSLFPFWVCSESSIRVKTNDRGAAPSACTWAKYKCPEMFKSHLTRSDIHLHKL